VLGSMETLLDILIVLFDECSGSSLRREKTVSEFIELGEFFLSLSPVNINILAGCSFCSFSLFWLGLACLQVFRIISLTQILYH
jgi:hypothetical protein